MWYCSDDAGKSFLSVAQSCLCQGLKEGNLRCNYLSGNRDLSAGLIGEFSKTTSIPIKKLFYGVIYFYGLVLFARKSINCSAQYCLHYQIFSILLVAIKTTLF